MLFFFGGGGGGILITREQIKWFILRTGGEFVFP